jgi:hypothetical protein
MTKEFILEKQVILLERGYDEMAQAYHCLCNIIHKDRHTSQSWELCSEPTCLNARNFICHVRAMSDTDRLKLENDELVN